MARRCSAGPVQQAGAQEQILDIAGLALQHLGEQVFGDRSVVAGELLDEPLGIGVIGQGDYREAEARGPSFRPLVQQRRPGLRQCDIRGGEKLAGLLPGETQIRRADLSELAGQAQLMQAQPQVAARGQHRVHAGGKVRQQPGELGEGVRDGQLVQIVDDQDEAAATIGELG